MDYEALSREQQQELTNTYLAWLQAKEALLRDRPLPVQPTSGIYHATQKTKHGFQT